MQYRLYAPKAMDCTIDLPASKSISNRALIINALSGSKETPENLSDCDDTDVMVNALRDMPYEINIKAAGTAMRFTTALLSVTEGEEHVITGTDRMKHRPIEVLVNALRNLGADIEYAGEEGFPPLKIRGKKLAGGLLEIPGNVSSQYISALLMIGPRLTNGLTLRLTGDIISRPYIEMTICTMQEFGADAEWTDGSTIRVKAGGYKVRAFFIENDWSASSYWYEMAALSEDCEIRLQGLGSPSTGSLPASLQGDAVIAEWMRQLGVGTFVEGNDIVLRKIPFEKRSLHFDFSFNPDLYPTMVATCAGLNVEATFTGLDNLALKESDRVRAMQKELAKLGKPSLHFCAHNDHRIVMALAPLALLYGPVTFDHPEVVEKSYPNYWIDASFLPVNR